MMEQTKSSGLTMYYFEDWKTVQLACPQCEWQGLADPSRLEHSESWTYPASFFRCPTCGNVLLTIERSAPLREMLAHLDQLSPGNRAHALELKREVEEFESLRLKDAEQLPDLDFVQGPDRLIWDIEKSDDKRWTVIRHGIRVIWRQPAFGGVAEFARVAAILRERYGKAIRDLKPADELTINWLTGDQPWYEAEIDKARRSLGWSRLP